MPQIYNKDDINTIIGKIASNIAKHNPDKYEILTSSESKRHPSLSDIQYDIALFSKTNQELISIIFVETETSLSLARAQTNWLPIAKRGLPLEIAVPKSKSKQAKTIAKKLDIHIKIIIY